MTPVDRFEFVLVLIAVILALELVARKLRAPPAAALILGGLALTLIPGAPHVVIGPQLILTLFLPPLLMSSAWFTAWREFRRHMASILMLAVGAVLFTTLAVAAAVHLALPSLPWAACVALGAVVSPPDAVAAKAVLEGVRLPRRMVALLEGESLLNDAAALVLFRFAIVAALTGRFSPAEATATFVLLSVGGVLLGILFGVVALWLIRRIQDRSLLIPISLLLPYASYIGGERAGVSGVIACVVTGLVLGWHQHEVLPASERRAMSAVWEVLVHLLEAFVFVLIGLSLRGASADLGGPAEILHRLGRPIVAVVAVVIASRFLWVLASDLVRRVTGGPHSFRGALVMGWAGMRGVVTLAVALSVPEGMEGRDVILMSAFAVIFVTVLGQGTTLGALIRLLRVVPEGDEDGVLTQIEALSAMVDAQSDEVKRLAYAEDGTLIHPRLLEQFTYRAELLRHIAHTPTFDVSLRDAHFGVLLSAVAAGRREVIRLHRAGRIPEETLHTLEHELDLQEISARRRIGGR